jgi:hypothetical protein
LLLAIGDEIIRTRLVIVAAIAFILGAAVAQFIRVTSYHAVIASQAHRLQLQQQLIDELQQQRAEVPAILEESE